MKTLAWLRHGLGHKSAVPILFGVSLLHFLIADSKQLFLRHIPISILIVLLFISEGIVLKIFLATLELGNTQESRLWSKYEILQPSAFSAIFLLIQILTINLRGYDKILNIIGDPQSFAYYSLALRVTDPLIFVREWLDLMQVPLLYWGGHLATHFPGHPLMIYFGFQFLGRNPQSVVWLSIVLTVLAMFPLFYLAKLVSGPKVALLACVLYTWIPSLSLNLPYMDLTVGTFTSCALLLFIHSLRSDRGIYHGFLGGLILSFALFLTFVSASVLILAMLLAMSVQEMRQALLKLLAFLSGVFTPYLILELVFDMPFFEGALSAFKTNQWFYQHLHSLMPSVWSFESSAFFFFLLLGLPVCALFLLTVLQQLYFSLRHVRTDAFTLGVSAIMLVTMLFARLELPRVAAFLVPMLVICVAANLSRRQLEDSLLPTSLLLSFSQFLEIYTYISQATLLSRTLGYPVV